jgi:hypothetical protein
MAAYRRRRALPPPLPNSEDVPHLVDRHRAPLRLHLGDEPPTRFGVRVGEREAAHAGFGRVAVAIALLTSGSLQELERDSRAVTMRLAPLARLVNGAVEPVPIDGHQMASRRERSRERRVPCC